MKASGKANARPVIERSSTTGATAVYWLDVSFKASQKRLFTFKAKIGTCAAPGPYPLGVAAYELTALNCTATPAYPVTVR